MQFDKRQPVDERYLLNASLTFENFFRGMKIQLSGYNLLDDDHRDPDYSGTLKYDLPQAGRAFMAELSYSF